VFGWNLAARPHPDLPLVEEGHQLYKGQLGYGNYISFPVLIVSFFEPPRRKSAKEHKGNEATRQESKGKRLSV
jgi:hypothetical protein